MPSPTGSRRYWRGDQQARRFNVDSDGLLVAEPQLQTPRWIRRVVKRYSDVDFENASVLSEAQSSRDEYLVIELPVLVHAGRDQQLDAAPARTPDEILGTHLRLTQNTFDSEQFCQRRADQLCADRGLAFAYCEDYDIRVQHVCPLGGDVICTAQIKIGAVDPRTIGQFTQPYIINQMFVWNIDTDSFRLLTCSFESNGSALAARSPVLDDLPHLHFKTIRNMIYSGKKSLKYLRDPDNYTQIMFDGDDMNDDSIQHMDDILNEDGFNDEDLVNEIDDLEEGYLFQM